jgi:type II secretory pathway component PulC
MNMKKDISPEEKLLRLIKGSKKRPPKEESAPNITPQEAGSPSLGASAYQKGERLKGARAISIPFPFKLRGMNTRTLNSVLIVILLGLLSYFIYDLFYTAYYKEEELKFFEMEDKRAPKAEGRDTLEIKPYSHYSSAIKGRNIFMPQQVEEETVITGPTVDEISANLSLIGIIAGGRPQAIIEDKKSKKSHFLYKGGTVGQAKVVEVLEDSVIMEYQGQRFELVL